MRITAGRFKNRRLFAPKGKTTRPTTEKLRQSVFNSLQERMKDSSFLDIFAGSGAMGLEALSRGATFATFIEKNPMANRFLRKNIRLLEAEKETRLLATDAKKALITLANEGAVFDIIYADPPYDRQEVCLFLLKMFDTLTVLAHQGVLILETKNLFSSPPLHTLFLTSTRKMGDTLLYFYSVSS